MTKQPCPTCNGTGERTEPTSNVPVNWDWEFGEPKPSAPSEPWQREAEEAVNIGHLEAREDNMAGNAYIGRAYHCPNCHCFFDEDGVIPSPNHSPAPAPDTGGERERFHPYGGGFTDANGQQVEAGDFVEHGDRFARNPTGRRGILIEALSDGDATVFFSDKLACAPVKWMNLCKIASGNPTPLAAASGPIHDKTEEHDTSGKLLPILFKDGRFEPSAASGDCYCDNYDKPTVDPLCPIHSAAERVVSPSDPLVILAGIKQFGLAPDRSDIRDLEAAITTLADELDILRPSLAERDCYVTALQSQADAREGEIEAKARLITFFRELALKEKIEAQAEIGRLKAKLQWQREPSKTLNELSEAQATIASLESTRLNEGVAAALTIAELHEAKATIAERDKRLTMVERQRDAAINGAGQIQKECHATIADLRGGLEMLREGYSAYAMKKMIRAILAKMEKVV